MANTLQIKHSTTASAIPSSLADGELAINQIDAKLYWKDNGGTINYKTLVAEACEQIVQNTQTASYTLVLTDKATKYIEMNVASANNLTVPPNSSVAFPLGTQIVIVQYGAGQTTVVAGAGVTIRSSGAKLKLTGQYSAATLIKRATDEWYLIGDITT